EHVHAAVDLTDLLAFGDGRAVAGRRVETTDAGAARPNALGQGPLRDELDLELAREVELLEGLVLADVRRGHLRHLASVQQDAQALVVDAAVVGDDAELSDALAG